MRLEFDLSTKVRCIYKLKIASNWIQRIQFLPLIFLRIISKNTFWYSCVVPLSTSVTAYKNLLAPDNLMYLQGTGREDTLKQKRKNSNIIALKIARSLQMSKKSFLDWNTLQLVCRISCTYGRPYKYIHWGHPHHTRRKFLQYVGLNNTPNVSS